MVPAGSVNMTMRNLFFSCLTDRNNLNIEVQFNAGQWMISVDCNSFVCDFPYFYNISFIAMAGLKDMIIS